MLTITPLLEEASCEWQHPTHREPCGKSTKSAIQGGNVAGGFTCPLRADERSDHPYASRKEMLRLWQHYRGGTPAQEAAWGPRACDDDCLFGFLC